MTQFAADTAAKDVKTNIGIQFFPSVGPELDWDPGEVNIRFEMDKLNFDWRVNQTQFKFIPGDIEISVKQQPDVSSNTLAGRCMCRLPPIPTMSPSMYRRKGESPH